MRLIVFWGLYWGSAYLWKLPNPGVPCIISMQFRTYASGFLPIAYPPAQYQAKLNLHIIPPPPAPTCMLQKEILISSRWEGSHCQGLTILDPGCQVYARDHSNMCGSCSLQILCPGLFGLGIFGLHFVVSCCVKTHVPSSGLVAALSPKHEV